MKTIGYEGKTFIIPDTLTEGYRIEIDPGRPNGHLPYDINKLNGVNVPIPTDIRAGFPRRNNRMILDMPIKFPKSAEYRVPNELSGFMALIWLIADFGGSDEYCYLTIDESGESRTGGCHVDGFQGSRVTKPTLADYSFIGVDACPPDFFNTSFDVRGLDKNVHNYFKAFDNRATATATIHYPVENILEMSCYTVHRAAEVAQPRTFFRMTYSARKFDRLGNTHNPMFDYDWNMEHRNVAESLI